jgi:NAD(P)-dependent dehydrogenase (short-subunit alcohol dehydrogenase family)
MTLNPKPAVLITGASSGIGLETAKYLVHRGFRVFAGARKKDEGDLLIDVTEAESIAAAAAVIAAEVGERGLAGLVNNAGIAVPGPLEFVPIADFERQFEVNVTGQLRVIQAMLPLLRLARGRIVNISSIAGRSAMPVMPCDWNCVHGESK